MLAVASGIIGESVDWKGQVHFLVFKFTLLCEQQIATNKFYLLAVSKTLALEQGEGTFPLFRAK